MKTWKELEPHFFTSRSRNGLSITECLGDRIGKGANNAVYKIKDTSNGAERVERVLRRPLKRSDTRNKGSAKREAMYTVLASERNISPIVFDSWYEKESTDTKRKGLYMISEKFDFDIEHLIDKDLPYFMTKIPDMREQLRIHLESIVNLGLFNYDIKPLNIVCKIEPQFRFSFIDFGVDYCERLEDAESESLPLKDSNHRFLRELITFCKKEDMYHRIRWVMMVVMCIIFSMHMHELMLEKKVHRTTAWRCNFAGSLCSDMRRASNEKEMKLITWCLENKILRKVLTHYFEMDGMSRQEGSDFMMVFSQFKR
jgi:hypothetical protein